MNISSDIKIIRKILNLSQEEFSKNINVPFEVINRWENGKETPELSNVNLFYSYAYEKEIKLNIIYEQMLRDEYNTGDSVVLFHGAKNSPIQIIDLNHSKDTNDFGKGVYLGEIFEQASMYIVYSSSNTVYSYALNINNLKVSRFNVSLEWMLAIAYFRGWIDKYKQHKRIQDVLKIVEDSDVIIAPIADNRMFDLISEFVEGMITDLQCKYALSATDLGFQYVLKTNKALSNLKHIDELFLCDKEKDYYIKKRMELSKVGLDKVKVARIQFKNKGNYIEEILREEAGL